MRHASLAAALVLIAVTSSLCAQNPAIHREKIVVYGRTYEFRVPDEILETSTTWSQIREMTLQHVPKEPALPPAKAKEKFDQLVLTWTRKSEKELQKYLREKGIEDDSPEYWKVLDQLSTRKFAKTRPELQKTRDVYTGLLHLSDHWPQTR